MGPQAEQEGFEQPTFTPLACMAGLVAAVLGAGIWAGLAHLTGYEVGYVAWGIGGLVGLATAGAGGRGVPLGAFAALLSLLSIFCGKVAATHLALQEVQETDLVLPALYEADLGAAKAFHELGAEPSDEALAQFLIDHDYSRATDPLAVPDEDFDRFEELGAVRLRTIQAESPDYLAWKNDFLRSAHERLGLVHVEEELSLVQRVLDELSSIDLIFAALGIFTAWQLVLRASA